jgi:uncharacterized protein (DUF2141 family)
MVKWMFVLTILIFGHSLKGQQLKLTVTIKGLKSTKGQILLQVVNENNKEVTSTIEKPTAKMHTMNVQIPSKGKYAVNVIHDKNSNKKLDTNILGIPTEGWGCSNDARGTLGAPKHKDKLVNISADKIITINLVHY